MSDPSRLLVVDDEPVVLGFVRRVPEGLGFAVAEAERASVFKVLYESFQPSVVVVDLLLPDDAGIHLMDYLRARHSEARVILVTGLDRRIRAAAERLARAYGLRVVGSLAKPLAPDALRHALAVDGPIRQR